MEKSAVLAKIDVALQIYDAVNNALIVAHIPRETAAKYSYFAMELYRYIKDSPELQTALQGTKSTYDMAKGAKGYVAAARLAHNAKNLNLVTSAAKLTARSSFSAGGAISAFVDYFVTLARRLNIEVDDCAVEVTKVMLDVLTTLALVESIVGIWAGAFQVLAVGADSTEMIKACFAKTAADAR